MAVGPLTMPLKVYYAAIEGRKGDLEGEWVKVITPRGLANANPPRCGVSKSGTDSTESKKFYQKTFDTEPKHRDRHRECLGELKKTP
jgi:hypothetical protein